MYGFQQERVVEPARAPSPRGQLQDGTRQFMNGVYLWMADGVSITGVVAWGITLRWGDARQVFMLYRRHRLQAMSECRVTGDHECRCGWN